MLRRARGRLLDEPPLFAGLVHDREPVVLRDDVVVRRLVAARDQEAPGPAPNRLVLLRREQDDRRAALVLALAEKRVRPLGQLELGDLVVDLLVRRAETRLVPSRAFCASPHVSRCSRARAAETGGECPRWRRAKSGWRGTRRCFGSSTSTSRTSPVPSTSATRVTRCRSRSSASAAAWNAWTVSS